MEKIFMVKEFFLNENTCDRGFTAKPFREYEKAKEYFDKVVTQEKENIATHYDVKSFEEVIEEVLCDEGDFINDTSTKFGGYFLGFSTIEIELVEEVLN